MTGERWRRFACAARRRQGRRRFGWNRWCRCRAAGWTSADRRGGLDRYGQRAQQDGIHDAEDGGVRADAERQREDGRDARSRGCHAASANRSADREQLVEPPSGPSGRSAPAPRARCRISRAPAGGLRRRSGLRARRSSASSSRWALISSAKSSAVRLRLNMAMPPRLAAPGSRSRIRPIARVSRRHSPVFSSSCSRPFGGERIEARLAVVLADAPLGADPAPCLPGAAARHRASRDRQERLLQIGAEWMRATPWPWHGPRSERFEDQQVEGALQQGDAVVVVLLGSHSTQVSAPLG